MARLWWCAVSVLSQACPSLCWTWLSSVVNLCVSSTRHWMRWAWLWRYVPTSHGTLMYNTELWLCYPSLLHPETNLGPVYLLFESSICPKRNALLSVKLTRIFESLLDTCISLWVMEWVMLTNKSITSPAPQHVKDALELSKERPCVLLLKRLDTLSRARLNLIAEPVSTVRFDFRPSM